MPLPCDTNGRNPACARVQRTRTAASRTTFCRLGIRELWNTNANGGRQQDIAERAKTNKAPLDRASPTELHLLTPPKPCLAKPSQLTPPSRAQPTATSNRTATATPQATWHYICANGERAESAAVNRTNYHRPSHLAAGWFAIAANRAAVLTSSAGPVWGPA